MSSLRDLKILIAHSNPIGYESRRRLTQEFINRIEDAGGSYALIELSAPGEPYDLPEKARDQVFSNSVLWHKENQLNIAFQNTSQSVKKFACIDADVQFIDPHWIENTLDALDSFPAVQMFSHCVDMGPCYELTQVHAGFMYQHYKYLTNSQLPRPRFPQAYTSWHSGYAWAYTREFLEDVGGLMDRAILGSADRHMAAGLIGQAAATLWPGVSPGYVRMVMDWQERAQMALAGSVPGFIRGTIMHHFHGDKVNRGYTTRPKILADHQFDPYVDVRLTDDGVLEWAGNKPALEQALVDYFVSRQEDA